MISSAGYLGAFVSSVLVSRLLGVEGKGLFSLFIATVGGLMIVATLGMPQGQMYHASKNPQWLSHFVANAIPLSILTGGAVALAYFVGGRALGLAQVTSLGWAGFWAGVIAVPMGVLLMYQRQYFLTLHHYELAKAGGAILTTLPLVGYLALHVAGRAEVSSFLGAFVITQIICFALFRGPARRVGPMQGGFSSDLARRSLAFGARQYASDVAAYLMSRLDFFIVAMYLGAKGLGIYSVAVGLAEIIMRVANEVGTMLYPVFAGRSLRPGRPAAALRTMILMSGLVAAGLAVISAPLVRIVYGAAFADSIPVLRWLLLGTVAWSTTHVTWTYVSSHGRPGIGFFVFSLAAGVDVLLNMVLLPRVGVTGAAIAATVSYAVASLIFFSLFRRAEGCTVRAALVPTRADLHDLWQAFAEALRSLLRSLRLRAPQATKP